MEPPPRGAGRAAARGDGDEVKETATNEEIAAACEGLDWIHSACAHLRRQFDMKWPRLNAAANLEARAILCNCSNLILKEMGMGITASEVEAARGARKVQVSE